MSSQSVDRQVPLAKTTSERIQVSNEDRQVLLANSMSSERMQALSEDPRGSSPRPRHRPPNFKEVPELVDWKSKLTRYRDTSSKHSLIFILFIGKLTSD